MYFSDVVCKCESRVGQKLLLSSKIDTMAQRGFAKPPTSIRIDIASKRNVSGLVQLYHLKVPEGKEFKMSPSINSEEIGIENQYDEVLDGAPLGVQMCPNEKTACVCLMFSLE